MNVNLMGSGDGPETGEEPECQLGSRDDLDELRSKLRDAKSVFREQQRESLLKRKRFMGDAAESVTSASPDDLVSLAKKLKQKSHVTPDLLKAIMNTLLDSQGNIEAFMSVDGALQALLRTLTGQNENLQVLGARCICNLALGNSKIALQVLKASDSYIFAHLAGRNYYLMEACAVALGNFSTHGPKHIQLLLAQGFFPKVTTTLLNTDNEMLESSLVYALTQMVYHGFDLLRIEDFQNALQSVIPAFKKEKCVQSVFLMSVLSAQKSCHDLMYHHQIHILSLRNLTASLKDGEDECVYYLRVLCNCMSQESGEMARHLIQDYHCSFLDCLMYLLQSEQIFIKRETLSLIGNLVNHPVVEVMNFALCFIQQNFQLVEMAVKIVKGEKNL